MYHPPKRCFNLKKGILTMARRPSQPSVDQFEDRQTDRKSSQTSADELEDRLIDFAVRIIKLAASLPNTPAGRHIAGQILRAGTSPPPNYGEARGAESRADFIHKISIVLKELNETSIWLRIIKRSEMLRTELLTEIMEENGSLCRIFTASLKTMRSDLQKRKMRNGKRQTENN
jgi:four helix bundle protein